MKPDFSGNQKVEGGRLIPVGGASWWPLRGAVAPGVFSADVETCRPTWAYMGSSTMGMLCLFPIGTVRFASFLSAITLATADLLFATITFVRRLHPVLCRRPYITAYCPSANHCWRYDRRQGGTRRPWRR